VFGVLIYGVVLGALLNIVELIYPYTDDSGALLARTSLIFGFRLEALTMAEKRTDENFPAAEFHRFRWSHANASRFLQALLLSSFL
jgi:hypothetical protein